MPRQVMIPKFVLACGEPPVFGNADQYPPNQITVLPVQMGTVVHYKCRNRYSHPDATTIFNSTCANSGTWTESRNCER